MTGVTVSTDLLDFAIYSTEGSDVKGRFPPLSVYPTVL